MTGLRVQHCCQLDSCQGTAVVENGIFPKTSEKVGIYDRTGL